MSINSDNSTKFKEYYSNIAQNPAQNRKKLTRSIHSASEKIKNLDPHTRLSFGPKGEIAPDKRFNITRGIAGYVPSIIHDSGWSDDISNLQYWSENVLTQFDKFGVADNEKVVKDLKGIRKGIKELKVTYKEMDKPEHVKVVKQVIKQINRTIKDIRHNSEKKYNVDEEKQEIRPQYLKSKREIYKEEIKQPTNTAYDSLKSTLGGKDLGIFIESGTVESKYFKELHEVLVPGVTKQLGKTNLAAEIVIESGGENFELNFTALKKELQKIKDEKMPLDRQRADQIEALKNSGLFPVIFERIEANAQKKMEGEKKELKLEKDNAAFWGNVKILFAGGIAMGASAFLPAIPGSNMVSGIGQKYAKQALDDLVGQWYGKEPKADEKKRLMNQLTGLEEKLEKEGPEAFYNAFTQLYGEFEKTGKETKGEFALKIKEAKAIVDELTNQLKLLG